MKITFIIISVLFLSSCNTAVSTKNNKEDKEDKISIETKDSLIFDSFLKYTEVCHLNNISNNATFFLNTPYKGGTLDINKEEQLVINLRELDCLTFVENVLALYLCRKKDNLDLNTFKSAIQKIRYRDGKLKSYISRLHYSTDWLYNNQKKGFIKDISKDIGGTLFKRTINFMSQHSNKYSALNTKRSVNRIKNIENKINKRNYYYIPKKEIKNIERKIGNGDIIFITTNIKGLDIAHVGYALNVNNRIHLIHASSQYKKVIISKSPLSEYLNGVNHFTGIMVARINQ